MAPIELTPMEVATGVLLGSDPAPDPLTTSPAQSPLEALERALLPALAGGRCCVAFSGGRDSSALLAVAVGLARRAGLPPPVPLTMRWPGDAAADERSWQEQLVRHLGLTDWEVVTGGDELDLLGPVATGVLHRHGVLWPAPAFMLVPLLERASGAALVVGDGGDQLFGGWRLAPLGDVLTGRRRPRGRDLGRAGRALAPPGLRARVDARRWPPHQTWLRRPAYRRFRLELGRDLAAEPATWPAFVSWTSRRRETATMRATWATLAADCGAELSLPLWDPGFLAALAAVGGRWGIGGRTHAMQAVFGGVLPDGHLRRSTKADFTRAFWCAASREFAREWVGEGVDLELVDPEALRAEWLAPRPRYGSATALHAAWLAATRSDAL